MGGLAACSALLVPTPVLSSKHASSCAVLSLTRARVSSQVGYGSNPPLRAANPAASCPSSLTTCDASITDSAEYQSTAANPNVLYGALVAGPDGSDRYADERTNPDNSVSIDYNGGLSAALALAAGRDWSVCDERSGLFDQVGAHVN